jgi:hypothetical protein
MWLFARPTVTGYVAGLAFLVVGHALRIWGSGYLDKLNELITAGPFAHTRNPLYAGSFLLLCGYAFMAWRLDVAAIMMMLFALFHGGAILYEEQLLRERFGDSFTEYCKHVPRIFPKLSTDFKAGGFSWRMVWHNREHRIMAGTLIMALLFGLVLRYPQAAPILRLRGLW